MDTDLAWLKQLMRAFRRHGLSELEIHEGDRKVILRRDPRESSGFVDPAPRPTDGYPIATAAPGVATGMSAPPPAPPAAVEADPSLVTVTAPLVGTFFRAPSPDASAFVEVGSTVSPGTVLCIIEAMKLMNEIESEVSGTVVEVLAANGRPVEYGEALFRVRRSG
ncbi:MAG: acetyl-CoA carboxylase biotin carboxyl carrier protein [Polyangiales bacterium]